MKPNRIVPLLISIIIISLTFQNNLPIQPALALGTEFGGDSPIEITAQSYGTAPQANDHTFVADAGGELDYYTFRDDGDGFIRFNIPITRFYFNEADVNISFQNGFLSNSSVTYAVNKKILPPTAKLRLMVWDVDEDNYYCPEVDRIYVNGISINKALTGSNNSWSPPAFDIPIGVLKFPQSAGTNGNRPNPINNEISIDVDATNCGAADGYTSYWAVQVDWGAIEIASPIRPVLFAHGWTGSTTAFNIFENLLKEDGIPSAGQADLKRGLDYIEKTAPLLQAEIEKATIKYGVDKVNIFAHSKGGLVARVALDDDSIAEKVDNLITFATPHHGTKRATKDFVKWKCENGNFSLEDTARCIEAGLELHVDRVRNEINYSGCTEPTNWLSSWQNCEENYTYRPSVKYFSFAVNGDLAVSPLRSTTLPWVADAIPFPNGLDVNGLFNTSSILYDHTQLIEEEIVYDKAISCLRNQSDCPLTDVTSNEAANNSVSGDEYQTIFSKNGVVNTGLPQSFNVNIDDATQAIFELQSDQPIEYTLTAPIIGTIDPNTPNTNPNVLYETDNDGVNWYYRYQITNPTAGSWTNILSSTSESNFHIINQTNSSTKLNAKTDKLTYEPGEMIKLEVALGTNPPFTPFTGVVHDGIVTFADNSTTSLASFSDNGTNGDDVAGDGIYTMQFAAPNKIGHANITLNAIKNNIQRTTEISIAIALQTAEHISIGSESVLDLNNNSLYDKLNIDVNINVITSGQFEVKGFLTDATGETIDTGVYSSLSSEEGPLTTGLHTVTLTFEGDQIFQHGANGPYNLSYFIFDVTNSTLQVDSAENVHVTSQYGFTEFEHPIITIGNIAESVIDTNPNGKYNILRLQIDAELESTGNYFISGLLVDAAGREIAWTSSQYSASVGGPHTLTLDFIGSEIGRKRINGPYQLTNLSIYNDSGANGIFDEVYTTNAYLFNNFEGNDVRAILSSTATEDGWVLESTETSGTGGTMDAASTVLMVGDDALDRQYRSILSFDTSSLPDTALITQAVLSLRINEILGGGNPIKTFNYFTADVMYGPFGGSSTLAPSDFSNTPTRTVGPLGVLNRGGWYYVDLKTGKTAINTTGTTQVRLRFSLGDNDNAIANIIKIYSGNSTIKPQLSLWYYVP